MRTRGASLRDVTKRLGIPKSTLSYWFRSVHLSPLHQERLKKKNKSALITARKEAVKWHNAQKARRLLAAREEASAMLASLDTSNHSILELSLALLYYGEGMKKNTATALGNSDPLLLRFFVRCLYQLYRIEPKMMTCELHLRADQNPVACIQYWSRTLGIPKVNFRKPSFDKRTIGRPTYDHYKGVCIVSCGRVAIQRKLMYIATTFCESIASEGAISSFG